MTINLQLGTGELRLALGEADLVRALVDELAGNGLADGGAASAGSGSWTLRVDPTQGTATLSDARAGHRCRFPALGLRAAWAAGLAAVAARIFLAPRVVTLALLGSGLRAQLQLAVLARHVPAVSHVAVCAGEGARMPVVTDAVAADLDLAGIDVSETTQVRDAVFGANLVVLAGDYSADDITPAAGALVVNATGARQPVGHRGAGHPLYVDDRKLVTTDHEHIAADLGELIVGRHHGPSDADAVVRVDLLGVDAPNAHLAHELYRTCVRLGIGVTGSVGRLPRGKRGEGRAQ